MVQSARKGLSPKVFYDLAAAIKMPEKRLAVLINLSARTISNYKEQQKVLEPVYSEHLLNLIRLYEKGEDIFGNIDEFNYLAQQTFLEFEGKTCRLDDYPRQGGFLTNGNRQISQRLPSLKRSYAGLQD
jgi:hypothetical protein